MAAVFWVSVLVSVAIFSNLVVSNPGRKCGLPTRYSGKVLEESHSSKREFNHGDKVTYKCEHGHAASRGTRVSFCQKGVWSRLDLQCERKICGSAGEIRNGRFRQTGNAFGDTAHAECDRGYVLHGHPTRLCQANGWSGTIPTCVVSDFTTSSPVTAASCPLPPHKWNAVYHGTKSKYQPGETLSFSCSEGFQLNGNSNVLRCERTGTWNPKNADCQKVKCEKFNIANAKVKFVHLTFNTRVNISCRDGFHLKGPNAVTCGANSSWTPALPTCERAVVVQVTCPPPAVPNSTGPDVHKAQYAVGERLTISCRQGFQLNGSSQVTCGADGQWRQIPECRLSGVSRCQAPPTVPNALAELPGNDGHYESNGTVRYRCVHGYRMVRGPSRVHCVNGQWSDVNMECERKKCGSAGEITNGRYHYTGASFGDNATAQCDKGYFLVGVAVRHCTDNGWDGREAECEAVQCPDPPQVPGADLIFYTSGAIKHGHMASYRCHFGTLSGHSEISCTENGTWSTPLPRCKVMCPAPLVQYGVIVSGRRPQYQPEHSVTFRCDPGRKLSGSGVIKCGTDGQWKPRRPACMWYHLFLLTIRVKKYKLE